MRTVVRDRQIGTVTEVTHDPETAAPTAVNRWPDEALIAVASTGLAPRELAALVANHPHPSTAPRPPAPALQLARAAVTEGGFVVCATDPDYPQGLRAMPSPPPFLFAMGNQDLLERPGVSVTGTRTPAGYGTLISDLVASIAASNKATLVHGGAIGCDTTAAHATHQYGGAPVLVPATGPDAHPLTPATLAAGGLVLSEHPFGTQIDSAPGYKPAPAGPRLLARNRIIVGLGSCLVPLGGAFRSGTAATVWLALAAGRPVVVARPKVPGLDTVLPTALAHPDPVSAAKLQAAGCPPKVAQKVAGSGPVAHAVVDSTAELEMVLRTYCALMP